MEPTKPEQVAITDFNALSTATTSLSHSFKIEHVVSAEFCVDVESNAEPTQYIFVGNDASCVVKSHFHRKTHCRRSRLEGNGAICIPDDVCAEIVSLRTVQCSLSERDDLGGSRIKDIRIAYVQPLNAFGLLLYFNDEGETSESDTLTLLSAFGSDHFQHVRVIAAQCKKYWECPEPKCQYKLNAIIQQTAPVFFCDRCHGDFTFHHNPYNHFYSMLNARGSGATHAQNDSSCTRDTRVQLRSCIQYRFVTAATYSALERQHHIHQSHQQSQHLHHKYHHHRQHHSHRHHQHQRHRQTPSSSMPVKRRLDPKQQQEQQERDEHTLTLFEPMSHAEFQLISATSHATTESADCKLDNDDDLSTADEAAPLRDSRDSRDWMDDLTLYNLYRWFQHQPGTRLGCNDYNFEASRHTQHACTSDAAMHARIAEIVNLSVRCKDSQGERHGVDHDCIECKPWLKLLRHAHANDDPHLNAGKQQINKDRNDDNDDDDGRHLLLDEELHNYDNFYIHHSFKPKQSWLCSLCQQSIPLDIKKCICIHSNSNSNSNINGNKHFPHHKSSSWLSAAPSSAPTPALSLSALLNNSCKSKDNITVIKELADFLHVAVAFNPMTQEYKTTAKPFEFEIRFDGDIIAYGSGNSKRKAKRDAAEIALEKLSHCGHERTIKLLQHFGRMAHVEVDRNEFVEVCRDRSDLSQLYYLCNANPMDRSNMSTTTTTVMVEDAPDIETYKTRVVEISQLDEPSVLGCLDSFGGNKFSLMPGIFHKDVNNGRYGYNGKNYHFQRFLQRQFLLDPPAAVNENCEEKQSSKKKRKKRRNAKRKKKLHFDATCTETVAEVDEASFKATATEAVVVAPISALDHEALEHEFKQKSEILLPNVVDDPLQLQRHSDSQSVDGAFLFPEPAQDELPHRRHSCGSTAHAHYAAEPFCAYHSFRQDHAYAHSPMLFSRSKPFVKSNRRRRRLFGQQQQQQQQQRGDDRLECKDSSEVDREGNNVVFREQHDVYVCCECHKMFADTLNGKYCSEHCNTSRKWHCFACLKRMKKRSENTEKKQKKIEHAKLDNDHITPPSSDDDGAKARQHVQKQADKETQKQQQLLPIPQKEPGEQYKQYQHMQNFYLHHNYQQHYYHHSHHHVQHPYQAHHHPHYLPFHPHHHHHHPSPSLPPPYQQQSRQTPTSLPVSNGDKALKEVSTNVKVCAEDVTNNSNNNDEDGKPTDTIVPTQPTDTDVLDKATQVTHSGWHTYCADGQIQKQQLYPPQMGKHN